MTAIDGNTLEGVSATTLRTLHNRGTVAGAVPPPSPDIAWPPGRRWWRFAGWPPLDRFGPLRRIRPSITLLEFG